MLKWFLIIGGLMFLTAVLIVIFHRPAYTGRHRGERASLTPHDIRTLLWRGEDW